MPAADSFARGCSGWSSSSPRGSRSCSFSLATCGLLSAKVVTEYLAAEGAPSLSGPPGKPRAGHFRLGKRFFFLRSRRTSFPSRDSKWGIGSYRRGTPSCSNAGRLDRLAFFALVCTEYGIYLYTLGRSRPFAANRSAPARLPDTSRCTSVLVSLHGHEAQRQTLPAPCASFSFLGENMPFPSLSTYASIFGLRWKLGDGSLGLLPRLPQPSSRSRHGSLVSSGTISQD
jgi:hypothetical protein